MPISSALARAKHLYSIYIDEQGLMQCNVSNENRLGVYQALFHGDGEEITSELFVRCTEEILGLMYRDAFPRYIAQEPGYLEVA